MKKFSSFQACERVVEDEDEEKKNEDRAKKENVEKKMKRRASISPTDDSDEEEEIERRRSRRKEKKRRKEKRTRDNNNNDNKTLLSDAEKIAMMEEKYGERAKDERAYDDRDQYLYKENERTSTKTSSQSLFFEDRKADAGNLAFGKPAKKPSKFTRDDLDSSIIERNEDFSLLLGQQKRQRDHSKEEEEEEENDSYFIPLLRGGGADDNDNEDYDINNNINSKRKLMNKLITMCTKETIEDVYKLNDKSLLESMEKAMNESTNENEKLRELTKIHNALTRREPRNVKRWIQFIKHQDNFLKMSKKRSEREIIKEKTIAICERALEWNPNDVSLLICLLKCSQECESKDKTKERWVRLLREIPSSVALWQNYIDFIKHKTMFSEFNCEDVVYAYEDALRALAKEYRAASEEKEQNQIELSKAIGILVLELVQFEVKSGKIKVAFRRLQAHLEFRSFTIPNEKEPAKLLRAFEMFWKSKTPRLLDNSLVEEYEDEDRIKGWVNWFRNEKVDVKHIRSDLPPPPPPRSPQHHHQNSLPSSSIAAIGDEKTFSNNEELLGNTTAILADDDDNKSSSSEYSDIDEEALAAEFAKEFDSAVDSAVNEDTIREWLKMEYEKMENPFRKGSVEEDDNGDDENNGNAFDSINAGLITCFDEQINAQFIEHCFTLLGFARLFGTLVGNPDDEADQFLRDEKNHDGNNDTGNLFPFSNFVDISRTLRIIVHAIGATKAPILALAVVKSEREQNGPKVALAFAKSMLSESQHGECLQLYAECAALTRETTATTKTTSKKAKKKDASDPAKKLIEKTIINATRISNAKNRVSRGLAHLVKESVVFLFRCNVLNDDIARYIFALVAYVRMNRDTPENFGFVNAEMLKIPNEIPSDENALSLLAEESISVLIAESSSALDTNGSELTNVQQKSRDSLEYMSDLRVCANLLQMFCCAKKKKNLTTISSPSSRSLLRYLRNLSTFCLEKVCVEVLSVISDSSNIDGKEIVGALFHDIPSSKTAIEEMMKNESFESKRRLKLALALARELCFARARVRNQTPLLTQIWLAQLHLFNNNDINNENDNINNKSRRKIFERALRAHDSAETSTTIWLEYLSSEERRNTNAENSEYFKSVFLRGIRSVPYDKRFWLRGIDSHAFTPTENAQNIDLMIKRGVFAHSDLTKAKLSLSLARKTSQRQ